MSTRHHMKLGILVAVTALAALMVFGTGSALAAAPDVVGPGNGTPFLCPSVGQGVLNHNPEAGQLASGGYTFLPGNNQAGANANVNALNTEGPGTSPGPGNISGPENGNSDWSPIWPTPTP